MKNNVQSRIKTMKHHFVIFHGAFNGLSGFTWNKETKMFEAEDDLWAERAKVRFRYIIVALVVQLVTY